MMKVREIITLAACILTLCLPLACKNEKRTSTTKTPIKVQVQTVKKQRVVSEKTYVGKVESATDLDLNSPFAARVEEVLVKQGQRVKKGDKLAILYSENVESMLATAQATMAQAQDGYDRLSKVKDNGSVSELKQVEVQTQLSKAQAMLKSAEKAKEDCTVKAPVDGTISEVRIQAGEELAIMQPLFNIIDLDRLEVSIDVPEMELGLYNIVDSAKVCVPALGEKALGASLCKKGVNAERMTHSYKCGLALSEAEEGLRPGMIGKVSFQRAEREAVVLPAKVLRVDDKGRYLWTVNTQDIVEKVYVQTGDYSGNGLIIESGLEEGMRVICEGMSKVCGGMKVSVE